MRHCPEDTVFYDVVERHQGVFFRIWKSRVGEFRGSCAKSLRPIFAADGWSTVLCG